MLMDREELRHFLVRSGAAGDSDGFAGGDNGKAPGPLSDDGFEALMKSDDRRSQELPPRDGRVFATAPVPAAVLLGLVAHPQGPAVILTERTAHLKDHSAEVSFPGGRIEATDADPAQAALREAVEEIGLPPDRVDVLGHLSPYDTISGFRIHPVVGWIDPPVEFRLDPFEVADVFEVPLSFVLDSANHLRDTIEVAGIPRSFYVLPYPGRYIWGATAGILVRFARLLQAPGEPSEPGGA
jgi:8-oxo-dGTP pyrophosphatase MutT (NUDIX family)